MKSRNFIYSHAQLGHREPPMTQRYAHLSPDHIKQIAPLTLRRPGAKVLEIAQGRNG